MWIKYQNKLYNLDKIRIIELLNGILWFNEVPICDCSETVFDRLRLAIKTEQKVFVIE